MIVELAGMRGGCGGVMIGQHVAASRKGDAALPGFSKFGGMMGPAVAAGEQVGDRQEGT